MTKGGGLPERRSTLDADNWLIVVKTIISCRENDLLAIVKSNIVCA